MKLTERLLKIAELVTPNKKIADIGTDHGYIPVYLLDKGIIDFAILADVNKGPLENARKEVRHNKLDQKVDLRLGSGLEVLKENEVDEVIIAGMGGVLISELLETSSNIAKKLDKLILQPMQAQEDLRRYLYLNGYEILNEVLVKEDFRIYEIIEAKYTGKNTIIEDDIYLQVGQKLIQNKDELLGEFINKKISMYEGIIKKLEGKDSKSIQEKINYSLEQINKFKGMI